MTRTTAAQPAAKISLFIAAAAIAATLAAVQPAVAQRAGGLFGEGSASTSVLAPRYAAARGQSQPVAEHIGDQPAPTADAGRLRHQPDGRAAPAIAGKSIG